MTTDVAYMHTLQCLPGAAEVLVDEHAAPDNPSPSAQAGHSESMAPVPGNLQHSAHAACSCRKQSRCSHVPSAQAARTESTCLLPVLGGPAHCAIHLALLWLLRLHRHCCGRSPPVEE